MISDKQKKILAFPYSRYDAIICDGAVRSGKTSIMMWAFVRWATEPDVGRVANGVSNRVDRLKCLGNAVVPQQAYPIFCALREELTRTEEPT